MKSKYSNAMRNKAYRLIDEGKSQLEVAGIIGCSHGTISNWIKSRPATTEATPTVTSNVEAVKNEVVGDLVNRLIKSGDYATASKLLAAV